MELYIIHRKATWEVSVKTPFRHLKVENNIPPAKTLSRAAFPARTWSCPWPFCEWMCFSTPGKHSPWPFGAALSDSSRCGITGKACPEGGKMGAARAPGNVQVFFNITCPWNFLQPLFQNLTPCLPACPESGPHPSPKSRSYLPDFWCAGSI